MNKREDFVTIQLTAKGEQVARGPQPPKDYTGPRGEPCIRIVGGGTGADGHGYDWCAKPGQTLEVTRGEWGAHFEPQQADGEPLFEIVSERAAEPEAAEEENARLSAAADGQVTS
jgi:hypothetical protein